MQLVATNMVKFSQKWGAYKIGRLLLCFQKSGRGDGLVACGLVRADRGKTRNATHGNISVRSYEYVKAPWLGSIAKTPESSGEEINVEALFGVAFIPNTVLSSQPWTNVA